MKIDLSNSEWKLMNRLWQTSPMTITELTAALREDTGWSKNTVITMLSRLEGKEAVRHEEGQRCTSPPWAGRTPSRRKPRPFWIRLAGWAC